MAAPDKLSRQFVGTTDTDSRTTPSGGTMKTPKPGTFQASAQLGRRSRTVVGVGTSRQETRYKSRP